jgi:hypothetical protein
VDRASSARLGLTCSSCSFSPSLPSANHVLQKALEVVDTRQTNFVGHECVGQVYTLATHTYACRVLQRIFENSPDEVTRPLMDEMHRYTQNLVSALSVCRVLF